MVSGSSVPGTQPPVLRLSTVEAYLVDVDRLAQAEQAAMLWHRCTNRAIVVGPATRGSIDATVAAEQQIEILERRTGGGPVLVTPDLLGLTVAIPAGHRLWEADLTRSYRWLGQALAEASRQIGLSPRLIDVGEARSDDSRIGRLACFAGRSPYEVFLDDGKLWGLAQRRTRQAALFVAGVYLTGDPAELAGYLTGPADVIVTVRRRLERVATLDQVAPGLPLAELMMTIERALARAGLTS